MITNAILTVFQTLLTFLLTPIPNIPQIPSPVIAAADYFKDLVGDVAGVISYLYTPTIFVLVFVILIAVINFEVIYKLIMWIYHKIRG